MFQFLRNLFLKVFCDIFVNYICNFHIYHKFQFLDYNFCVHLEFIKEINQKYHSLEQFADNKAVNLKHAFCKVTLIAA